MLYVGWQILFEWLWFIFFSGERGNSFIVALPALKLNFVSPWAYVRRADEDAKCYILEKLSVILWSHQCIEAPFTLSPGQLNDDDCMHIALSTSRLIDIQIMSLEFLSLKPNYIKQMSPTFVLLWKGILFASRNIQWLRWHCDDDFVAISFPDCWLQFISLTLFG